MVNYNNFSNRLHITEDFVTNNPTVIKVFTDKEKAGKEENQAPYRRLANFFKK